MNDTPADPVSDEELVRSYLTAQHSAAGRAAVESLLARYDRFIYLACQQATRDHSRGLDLAQEAMMEALRSLPSFDANSSFSSWLFTITRERCVRALGPDRSPDSFAASDLAPADVPPGADPAAAERRMRERLRMALDLTSGPDPSAARAAPLAAPTPPRSRRGGPAFAMVAVLIVVAGSMFWFASHRSKPAPAVIETPPEPELRVLPVRPAEVSPERVLLRWRSIAGATRYEVRLLDPRLAPIGAPHSMPDTSWLFDPAVELRGQSAGAHIFWSVTARRGEVTAAESPTEAFTLR